MEQSFLLTFIFFKMVTATPTSMCNHQNHGYFRPQLTVAAGLFYHRPAIAANSHVFFFHLILLVLSHMSLKKYYLPMILNISSNGGIHRFIIDKLIFSCLCWFDHLCRPFCMQVVTKDDATPSFTAGSLLPSGAVDDIPSSRLT